MIFLKVKINNKCMNFFLIKKFIEILSFKIIFFNNKNYCTGKMSKQYIIFLDKTVYHIFSV